MKCLVVGVDGSSDSIAALAWAARTVGSNGTVHAVHALASEPAVVVAGGGGPHSPPDPHRALDVLTDEWVVGARDECSDVRCRVVDDAPADALVDTAELFDADGIVTGPGTRTDPSTGVGRVTERLLHRSGRPVVVVRAGADRPLEAGRSIVVGVGAPAATRSAIAWAARLAAERKMALQLVNATARHRMFGPDGALALLAYYIDPALLARWAEADRLRLAESVRRAAPGQLEITWTSSMGRPVPRLVEMAADAALVVIGRQADGRLCDHFTVCAIHHVLTHAPCPVVIVPAR